VKDQAEELANEAIVKLLVPSLRKKQSMQNPFEMLFGGKDQQSTDENSSEETEVR